MNQMFYSSVMSTAERGFEQHESKEVLRGFKAIKLLFIANMCFLGALRQPMTSKVISGPYNQKKNTN